MQNFKGSAMIGVGILLGCAILATSLRALAQPASGPQAPAAVGRYQLRTNHEEKVYVIDTVTGQVWDKSAMSGGGLNFYNPKR
jgi:hypothetical protein